MGRPRVSGPHQRSCGSAGPGLESAHLLKLLSRLEERGFVRGEKEGRSNGYTPLVNRPDYLAAESRSFLERVHGGSLSSLMAALYPEKELSREDIAELERILEKGGK